MDSNPIFRKCIGEEKYDIISLPHHYALTHYFHLPYINDCTFIGNLNKVAKIEITD